jgi:hypothetical protein
MNIMLMPLAVFLIAGAVDELADGFAHGRDLGRALEYSCTTAVQRFRAGDTDSGVPFEWIYLAPYFAFTFSYC